jgi:hypothetical protein
LLLKVGFNPYQLYLFKATKLQTYMTHVHHITIHVIKIIDNPNANWCPSWVIISMNCPTPYHMRHQDYIHASSFNWVSSNVPKEKLDYPQLLECTKSYSFALKTKIYDLNFTLQYDLLTKGTWASTNVVVHDNILACIIHVHIS